MIRNHKKLFISLALIISLGLAAWLIFETYSKQWLEDRINVLIADLRKNGATISYSSLHISVRPLSVQATFQNPHLKDSQNLIEWQGREVNIFMHPWNHTTLNFTFPGDQHLTVPQNHAFPLGTLSLEGAQGNLHLTSRGDPESATLNINHLSSVVNNQTQPLALKDFSLHVSHIQDPLHLKLSLSSQLINIDKFLKAPSKDHPFTLNFVADLSGYKEHLPFPKSLEAWRDGGGIIEVRLLKIDWPPILAEIEGTLTLDEEMYPLGSFSSKLQGYQKAINDMVTLGWIKQKKATVALFMLDLFASTNEKGEKVLKAPLTLQNKRFSIGPARLFKLKPVGGN